MARRRLAVEHENHERWLVSYADFITLLFAFFVVMFASSQTDKGRAKQVSESVEKAFSDGKSVGLSAAVAKILGGTVDDKGQGNAQMRGPGGAQRSAKEPLPQEVLELAPSLKTLSKELEAEINTGKVELSLVPRGLVISLKQAAFFPSGADTVDPATFAIVAKLAVVLKQVSNPIHVEGHTDSVPIHSARFRSNWELSAARSISMTELLVERFDVPYGRMAIVGFAENSPVDTNDTPEGRARNRRVDLVILNTYALGKPGADKPKAPAPAASKK
jgi:chemotaxis protein MotB